MHAGLRSGVEGMPQLGDQLYIILERQRYDYFVVTSLPFVVSSFLFVCICRLIFEGKRGYGFSIFDMDTSLVYKLLLLTCERM